MAIQALDLVPNIVVDRKLSRTVQCKALLEKVNKVAKTVFSEMLYWGGVVLGVVVTVTILKFALSNPITSIALIALLGLAWRNREKIKTSCQVYISSIKDGLGLKNHKWFDSITSNIVLGATPLENKNHRAIFKEMKIDSILSLSSGNPQKLKTFISKPVDPTKWQAEGVEFKPIVTNDPDHISNEELGLAADFINEVVDQNKKIYVHDELGSAKSASVVIAYFIKYQQMTGKEAIDFIKLSRPSLNFDVYELGRVHQFVDYIETQNNAVKEKSFSYNPLRFFKS